jgi:hypothetical protein
MLFLNLLQHKKRQNPDQAPGLADKLTTPVVSLMSVLGFGPAFLVPIATEKFLGTEKFGIGPSVSVMH